MPDVAGEIGARARVLVIESDSSRAQELRDVLVRDGHDVATVRALDEAQGHVAQNPPDVVLCGLDASDTLDLCRWVKGSDATRLIPVVVIATEGSAPRKVEALDAGAEDLLVRPVHPLEISARVRACVRLRKLTTALENAENVVFALATAIEQKDNYTEGHGARVAVYARSLAEHVGLSPEEIHSVHMGGVLHDVGKIGCPDAILNKPGPLTPDEFEIIKRHPMHGWEICRHLKSLGSCTLGCIRNHHERLDGSGYPDGLTESSIPRTTRIVSICDVFDALATARAYKPAFPTHTCFKILREESERGWWDREMVEAFVDMMRLRELDRPGNRAAVGTPLRPGQRIV